LRKNIISVIFSTSEEHVKTCFHNVRAKLKYGINIPSY